ncbi:MAG: prolipoprotein diacylglyceryl transferase [Bacillota bacterium]|nr:prolipoprotein diacylglyceryl transferase [Bacillota bacterium]
MYPVLFEIAFAEGSTFTVGAYRFFGFLAAVYLTVFAVKHLREERLSNLKIIIVISLTIAAFLIGSRLLYLVLYLQDVIDNPSIIWQLRLANFTLYGGLLLSLITWWLATRFNKVPFMKMTDYLAPHVGISVMFMRTGCFLNGCCYGKVTTVPWGIVFPAASGSHLAQIYVSPLAMFLPPRAVHPTQFYEMGAAFIASLAAWILIKSRVKEGLAAAVFGLIFSAGRLITYYFRDFPIASDISNLIRGPLVYSLAILFFSVWIFIALNSEKRQEVV